MRSKFAVSARCSALVKARSQLSTTVSVSIRENEFFTLLGPSGCGKTTLLRLIAGFDFPTDGEILLYGAGHRAAAAVQAAGQHGVPELCAVPAHDGGAEHRLRPGDAGQAARPRSTARVAEMLKLVQMEELQDRRTSQISGGQQQRVALARALAPQPKVLLLDEPLSALDYKLRKEMQIELKRLQHETGITFIFVTHDQEEALTMSDRIAVMSAGKILQIGTPARHLRPAGRALRRRLHRRDQFPRRPSHRHGNGKARVTLDVGRDDRRDRRRRLRSRAARSPSWCGPSMPSWPAAKAATCRARSRTSSISAPTRISTCSSTAATPSSCASRTRRSGRLRLRSAATRSASLIGDDAAQVLRD